MDTSFPFQQVAILGPGLLGGSVAYALRKAAPQCELRLWARRQQPLQLAQELQLADICTTDIELAVTGADLIILATPISAFLPLSQAMLPYLKEGSIVTDLGSVKDYVHRVTGSYLNEHGKTFIGSHPMAGGEKQGLEYAHAELLKNATIVICNEQQVAQEQVQKLDTFWQKLGGKTHHMGAKHHDQSVARISHMPHVLAGLCARGADNKQLPIEDLQRLASSGFRDTTRVCTGSPSMWADILWENDVAIREALTQCMHDLQNLIYLLEVQDKEATQEWLEDAKETRQTIFNN